MRRNLVNPYRFPLLPAAFIFVMASGLAFAQDQTSPTPPQNGTWRHMGDQAPQQQPQQTPPQTTPQAVPQNQNPEPVERADQQGDQSQQPAAQPPANQHQMNQRTPPPYGVPAQLNIKPGTYINIRINQMLHSDKNHAGDTFGATLSQPVIVDGIVVAARGQMVYGRVAEAEKAHDGKDSRLGLELTSITLMDGTQAPVSSRLVAKQGPTTPRGVEAGTVIGTTAAGAAIGGIAGRGTGAAIGAGAGAATGLAAVLLTHNHPTILYPETALTFEMTTPVAINTANAPGAYRYVGPEDYYQQNSQPPAPRPRPTYVYGPGYPYPYPYYYPYSPYYWGPSFGVGIGFGGRWGRRW